MDLEKIIEQMTLEEKVGMCSGLDYWHTKPVERLGVPSVMIADGPHGLRKQSDKADHLGVHDAISAVCFPAACATACSFDRELLREMGTILGNECQAENVSVLLGPAMNIKRSPLCGRNFEYISEDPYLTGELAASYIQGVQSQNVGVSAKHFAANNQEYERFTSSSEIDERTLREIYLTGFETAMKKAKPWTLMCSYNKINGVFASESKKLLTDILRDEWGFDGYVMSDWGAVSDRVAGVLAGLELEMPSSNGANDKAMLEAVQNGILPEDILDEAVRRILKVVFAYAENRRDESFDREADHQKAVEIARQCVVLLQNDGILPLREGEGTVAFIGGFAKTPRYQGGGSSRITSYRIGSTVEEAKKYGKIVYAEGFPATRDNADPVLFAEAVEAAKNADTAVIFAGLPDLYESEGYDRKHMRLPECQNELIREILKVQSNVVVVLHNGSPVELPWAGDVRAIVEAYLGGEGIAEALCDILFGRANPCGKLAESFPLRLQDNPSYLNFPGAGQKVCYAEGVFVGYRYYDSKDMPVRFPFGHGLSYTSFELSNLRLSETVLRGDGTITVTVDVKNTGAIAGKEVVQLYVRDHTGAAVRPDKELKGFEAVRLSPGEVKTVSMTLDRRSFSWYDSDFGDWFAAEGEYSLLLGISSRDIRLETRVRVEQNMSVPFIVDANTMVGELLSRSETESVANEKIKPILSNMLPKDDELRAAQMKVMLNFLPIRALRSFGGISNEQLTQLLEELNRLV